MLVRNRWMILSVSMVAQVASVSAMFGVPVVLPQLREAFGVTTAQAGMLAGLPSFGLLLTLLLWGVVIDRAGERATMALSLLLTAGALGLLWTASQLWSVAAVLFLVGAVGGPVNAASGRLVLTWFERTERGLAMGIRQSALPLGVGLSALVLPRAADAWGFVGAMLLPGALALVAVPLVLAMASAPPRGGAEGRTERSGKAVPVSGPAPARSGSPYRRWTIWRVHGLSMLLGVPQVTLMVYTVIYLVQEQGWSPPAAGAVVAAAQVPGAAGRLLLGAWSDRTGNRMRPVRWLAVVSGLALVLLTLLPNAWGWSAVPLVLLCLVLTMWHNGLTFLSVAEIAGTAWAGRALAVQNWLQAVSTTLTPVLMAAVITLSGLPAVFAVGAVFSALAVVVVPVRAEGRESGATGQ
ncbi:MAG: MFS transporter [Nocardiopsis sp. BM-2018]|uniref:Sugar phosphate permease n=1 Tax=Nocardiopsis metallicus TaxID=179819 RepID=A0A840WZ64_9ACTN|nr:MFS transporter [Nocardiopsis metallicus]MBB5495488.1 sugar phosphate permease [Nocardiopsis metallicus]QRN79111.1 MAG: MFS transporter [Nocardiopsis sp. BM-2018]